jgi:nicotinamide riboside transporter PnuC
MVKHTKEQRRQMMAEKYYTRLEKFFAAIVVALVFLVLLYAIYFSIVLGWDPFVTVVLVVALIVMVPVAAILLDSVCYE